MGNVATARFFGLAIQFHRDHAVRNVLIQMRARSNGPFRESTVKSNCDLLQPLDHRSAGMMLKSWIIATLSLLACGSSHAQVVATCGASTGYSYFLPGPTVPPEEVGWAEDGISNGGIQLIRDGDSFDIVYTDAIGGRSVQADGATVIGYPASSGFLVLAVYPDLVETYQFSGSCPTAWCN